MFTVPLWWSAHAAQILALLLCLLLVLLPLIPAPSRGRQPAPKERPHHERMRQTWFRLAYLSTLVLVLPMLLSGCGTPPCSGSARDIPDALLERPAQPQALKPQTAESPSRTPGPTTSPTPPAAASTARATSN